VKSAAAQTRRSQRRDEVFRALADPTRRAMLEQLLAGEISAGELAEPYEMSQPASSRHLKVLLDAGLVRASQRGRQRVYRLHAAPLREVFDWIALYERAWGARLDALGKYLDENDDET
jgi:DNA-binding transcriptional ArsR family regulator